MERGYAQICSVCSPRDSGWLTNGVATEAAAVTEFHPADYGLHVGDNAEVGALPRALLRLCCALEGALWCMHTR